MIVKIDVDGVIRDMLDALCKLYFKFDSTIKREDVTDYRVSVSFPLIKEMTGLEAHDYFFNNHAEDVGFLCAPLLNGAKEAIDKLKGHGHKVVIVTKQPSEASKIYTLSFLKYYGIAYDDICFTESKWLIKSDFMIDDNPEFLENNYEETPKHHRLIIDAPYNRDCVSFRRFNSLIDAVNCIIENNEVTQNQDEEEDYSY